MVFLIHCTEFGMAFIPLFAKLPKFLWQKINKKIRAFSFADYREEPKFITERTKQYAK